MPADPNCAKLLFLAATKLPPTDRPAFLAGSCGGDLDLRAAVERLLAAHEVPDSRIDRGAAEPDDLNGTGTISENHPSAVRGAVAGPTGDRPRLDDAPGLVLAGRYKLVEPIGEGGMGSVWMARQIEPVKRVVALKLIKAGMDSRAVLARFEAERQALALMDHPNIAKVLDAGMSADGRPFFVLELVKGVPITQFCDERKLTPRERLALFVPVCQAIQHAHQKGVIHRDIKPSNVLVALYDDRPVPKVIDFGVAKATGQVLTDKTLMTGFGVVVGTPEYMSPEQASFNQLDVDTRSDVYSLGVLLYELLSGTPPHPRSSLEKAGLLEILRVIREVEPPPPSARLSTSQTLASLAAVRGTEPARLPRLVRGELDWIVMKALEKNRTRRYETASGFAADVQRYLADEPVQAVPPSIGYRIGKVVSRHRAAVLTAAAFALLLVVGAVLSTYQAIVASRARTEAMRAEMLARMARDEEAMARAEATRAEARAITARDSEAMARAEAVAERDRNARNAYVSSLNLARHDWLDGNPARARALLTATRPAKPGDVDFRGFEWYYLDRLSHAPLFTVASADFRIPSVAISPDRTWIAIARDSTNQAPGDIQILDARTAREIRVIPAARRSGSGIVLNTDGTRVASCAADQSVVVWDTGSGALVTRLRGHKLDPLGVAFSRDGKLLASLGPASRPERARSEVKVWDLKKNGAARTTLEIPSYVYNLAFSPDGQFLATAGLGIQVRNAATGQLVWQTATTEDMTDVAYSPDGRSLAGSSFGGWIGFWNAEAGTRIATLPGHRAEVHRIAFTPDGKRLASAGRDRVIRIWDSSAATAPTELRGHESEVMDLAYSADGERLASASARDGVVHVWDPSRPQEYLPLPTDASESTGSPTFDLAFDSSGRVLAAARMTGGLQSWDVPRGSSLFRRDAKTPTGRNWVAFGSEPDLLATLDDDQSVVLLCATTGALIRRLDSSERTGQCGVFTPDGRYVAAPGREAPTVRIWEVKTGRLAGELKGHTGIVTCLAVSPDGRKLASGSLDMTVRVWDVASRQERVTFRGHPAAVLCIAFRPDGTAVASADAAGRPSAPIQLWEVSTGKLVASLAGHSPYTRRLAFLPDGSRLASLGDDGALKLWELTSGQEVLAIAAHRRSGLALAVSPDSRKIATAGAEGNVRVWDATPLAARP